MTLVDLVAEAAITRNDLRRAVQIVRQLEPWLEPNEYLAIAESFVAYYLALLRFETAEQVRGKAERHRKVVPSFALKLFVR